MTACAPMVRPLRPVRDGWFPRSATPIPRQIPFDWCVRKPRKITARGASTTVPHAGYLGRVPILGGQSRYARNNDGCGGSGPRGLQSGLLGQAAGVVPAQSSDAALFASSRPRRPTVTTWRGGFWRWFWSGEHAADQTQAEARLGDPEEYYQGMSCGSRPAAVVYGSSEIDGDAVLHHRALVPLQGPEHRIVPGQEDAAATASMVMAACASHVHAPKAPPSRSRAAARCRLLLAACGIQTRLVRWSRSHRHRERGGHQLPGEAGYRHGFPGVAEGSGGRFSRGGTSREDYTSDSPRNYAGRKLLVEHGKEQDDPASSS